MRNFRSSSLRFFAALALTITSAAATAADSSAKPNFSGEWQMDVNRSDFGKFPVPTSITRQITQKDPDLSVDTTQRAASGEQTAHAVYRTDGEETVNNFNSGTGTSHAFWDGTTLVIRTTMKSRSNVDVLMEERWELSDGGKTLTTSSHIETSKGVADLKLVCSRTK